MSLCGSFEHVIFPGHQHLSLPTLRPTYLPISATDGMKDTTSIQLHGGFAPLNLECSVHLSNNPQQKYKKRRKKCWNNEIFVEEGKMVKHEGFLFERKNSGEKGEQKSFTKKNIENWNWNCPAISA